MLVLSCVCDLIGVDEEGVEGLPEPPRAKLKRKDRYWNRPKGLRY